MKYGFGVDLGGTTVKIAFFDENGQILTKWEIPTAAENQGQQILPDIADSVLQFLSEKNIDKENLLGIGMGVPGPVRPDGIVAGCVNLGWGVFNVESTLSKLTGLPVKAGNDATVAALGECWKGGGEGYQNLIFVTLGTGVGGGIVVDGKVLHGTHGAGGEIGHVCIVPTETIPCNCGGYGCAEQYCSATGIVRLAKEYLAAHPGSSLENVTAKAIFDAAAAGNADAKAITDIYYDHLGRFLAMLCCVTDPEIIVLGGGVSKAGTPLLDGAKESFLRYAFPGCRETEFALATLGNDAGAYGAFRLICDQ